MERLLDILFSLIALALLAPLLLVVSIILKFSGEGEVLFFQERIGQDGRMFQLFKFATMLKDSPNLGSGTVTMKGDERILPVGKFLRLSKINELPQLFNIFLGHMSIVGPRPLTAQTFGSYSLTAQETIKRVRPGLSGVGSIVFRQEEELMHGESASVEFYNDVIAPYKAELEKWFVSNKSLILYFQCIMVTVWAVLVPDTQLPWRVFKGLPRPPDVLLGALNYPMTQR